MESPFLNIIIDIRFKFQYLYCSLCTYSVQFDKKKVCQRRFGVCVPVWEMLSVTVCVINSLSFDFR